MNFNTIFSKDWGKLLLILIFYFVNQRDVKLTFSIFQYRALVPDFAGIRITRKAPYLYDAVFGSIVYYCSVFTLNQ